MVAAAENWAAVMEQLLDGDRLALLKVSRLATSLLSGWRAFDFRDDWEDLIQESILAVALAVREGKLRERQAIVGYLRTTLRFKFVDHLKGHLRCHKNETLPWEEVTEAATADPGQAASLSPEARQDLQQALAKLPEKKRNAVLGVYLEGKTYDEVAADTGIPLGSLKRYLRDGLAELRGELAGFFEGG